MEKIDVLDKNGSKTNEIASRDEVHRLGLWHRCIKIWIVNDKGEILLQKRSMNEKSYPGKWTTATSGHLSSGDSSKEGAIRELSEEIGLIVNEEELEYLFTVKEKKEYNYKEEHMLNNEFTDVYLIKKNLDIENLQLEEAEVSEVKWFSYDKFKKMVLENDESLVSHHEMQMRILDILKT